MEALTISPPLIVCFGQEQLSLNPRERIKKTTMGVSRAQESQFLTKLVDDLILALFRQSWR